MHQQSAFENLNYQDEDLPISSKLCNTVLSLPIHPYIEEEDIQNIVSIITKNYTK